MIPTSNDPVATLVFFLLVFTVIGVVFLFIHLFMGSFLRPYKPDAEKLTIYECGEPTVGSAWVQFDLRYYVVALLFVIFDVEVAFFFPWATVFGTANQLAHLPPPVEKKEYAKLSDAEKEQQKGIEAQRLALSAKLLPTGLTKEAKKNLKLATYSEDDPTPHVVPIKPEDASAWANIVFWDILIFFGVLMVGFAYVWRRGDIDWVRAYAHHQEPPAEVEHPLEQPAPVKKQEPVGTH